MDTITDLREALAAKDAKIIKLKERLEQAEKFIPSSLWWCAKCNNYSEDDGQKPWRICEHCGENRSEEG